MGGREVEGAVATEVEPLYPPKPDHGAATYAPGFIFPFLSDHLKVHAQVKAVRGPSKKRVTF